MMWIRSEISTEHLSEIRQWMKDHVGKPYEDYGMRDQWMWFQDDQKFTLFIMKWASQLKNPTIVDDFKEVIRLNLLLDSTEP